MTGPYCLAPWQQHWGIVALISNPHRRTEITRRTERGREAERNELDRTHCAREQDRMHAAERREKWLKCDTAGSLYAAYASRGESRCATQCEIKAKNKIAGARARPASEQRTWFQRERLRQQRQNWPCCRRPFAVLLKSGVCSSDEYE